MKGLTAWFALCAGVGTAMGKASTVEPFLSVRCPGSPESHADTTVRRCLPYETRPLALRAGLLYLWDQWQRGDLLFQIPVVSRFVQDVGDGAGQRDDCLDTPWLRRSLHALFTETSVTTQSTLGPPRRRKQPACLAMNTNIHTPHVLAYLPIHLPTYLHPCMHTCIHTYVRQTDGQPDGHKCMHASMHPCMSCRDVRIRMRVNENLESITTYEQTFARMYACI